MTDYLEKQKVAKIKKGYNAAPGATPGGGALPGMKGIDLSSWRDLLKPRPDEPFPAGHGAVTGEHLRAIAEMQYFPEIYSVHRLK